MERVVIIGAGQAAAQGITSLRAEGFSGSITLVGDEPYAPYQRPPLSKAYLNGTFERERIFLKPEAFYAEARCELMLGVSATKIDRAHKRLGLADSRSVSYDKLLIATGSRVRKIKLPGSELPGVHYLRGIDDVDRLRAAFGSGRRLAIVGAGYIGLEVAAAARKLGLGVTVFEALDRVMARAVSPIVSEFYARVHREAGVDLLLNTGIEGFSGKDRVDGVHAGGKSQFFDVVLVAVGIVPNCELAINAGLACDDGIVVDSFCTSVTDPSIFAAGDCTRHHGRDGNQVRLECVQNAIDQARHAAMAMAGKPTPYSEVPWFWSDQYDLKLQIAGLAWASDRLLLRGDPATRKFAVFHLREGKVAAVEAINSPSEYLVGRKLIADRAAVEPERLADINIPMKDVV